MTLVRVSATGMCKPCGNIQRVFVDGEWRACQDCAGREAGMTTRDEAEERRLVDVLRPYQLQKLEERRSKGHWQSQDVDDLVKHLREEVDELVWELEASAWESDYPGAREKVAREAADVACLAAMIADIALSREKS